MSYSPQQLESELNKLLNAATFRDYCPNGLQVEGGRDISKIVSGVTASQSLIERAIEAGADALLVHHGYFWKGENPAIVGLKRGRVSLLLEHGISLLAYHLPLDAHPTLGNNAQLAKLLDLRVSDQIGPEGEPPLVWLGSPAQAITAAELATHLDKKLGRAPIWVAGDEREIRTLAWCTGAAQNYFEIAVAAGADAFITGEISEPSAHIARESGVHFYSAGHHATERYGVQAVGNYLAENFSLAHEFIDIDNPA